MLRIFGSPGRSCNRTRRTFGGSPRILPSFVETLLTFLAEVERHWPYRNIWHIICSASWIELVARVPHPPRDGWSKSCSLSGRHPRGTRGDKIPGDLSSQELALLLIGVCWVDANSRVVSPVGSW